MNETAPKGLLNRLKQSLDQSAANRKTAEIKGDTLVHSIEGEIVANLSSLLPTVSSEAAQETLTGFWNIDKNVQPSGEVIEQTVDAVMERLRIVNPGIAKIIDEYDEFPVEENGGSYLLTMILSALVRTDQSSGTIGDKSNSLIK